jgi:pyrrolidone-carboxylate peptidase
MSNYILAAIQSPKNTAQKLVENITCPDDHKALLPANTEKCVQHALGIIKHTRPDVLVVFEQKPLPGEIRVEIVAATDEDTFYTNYDYNVLYKHLQELGYKVKISRTVGNHFANTVYAKALEYIEQNDLHTQFLFIHIPVLIKPQDLFALSNVLKYFFEGVHNKWH